MPIKKDLLQKAGVPQKEIQALEEALLAYKSAQERPVHRVPSIVCAGIYNAGKSTLLNALCGEERFPTGNVPTTKAIARAEFDGAVYIDTPGLNAQEEDDQEAEAAYASADFILFVSSIQNGNISAMEAKWLAKLREQYTEDGLRQRLICVLSNYGQVEEEERDRLRQGFQTDLEKACGLCLKEIFCVDSCIYLDGKSQNEPLLMEYSGIPNLKVSLTRLIANAEDTLCGAREAELDTLRKTVTEQLSECKKIVESALSKCESQNNAAKVEEMFSEAKKKLDDSLFKTVSIGNCGLYLSYIGKYYEGKERASLHRQAKESIRTFAEKSLRIAHREVDNLIKELRSNYGNFGMGSRYFKANGEVNRVLEELRLKLVQSGIQVSSAEEINVQPDLHDLNEDVSFIIQGGDYWSPSEYLNIFDNRIEFYEDEYGYRKKGLFGEYWQSKYRFYNGAALREVSEHITKEYEYQEKRANEVVENYYWGPFVKELRSEANKQIQSMRQAATASLERIRKSAEQPLRDALDHLCKLEKEAAK